MSEIPENNQQEQEGLDAARDHHQPAEESTDRLPEETQPAENPSREASSEEQVKEVAEEDSSEEDHTEEDQVDYSHYSREELLSEIQRQANNEKLKQADAVAQELKACFDETEEVMRLALLHKFVETGGEETDFEFRPDAVSEKFYHFYRQIKDKKNQLYQRQHRERSHNLTAKQEVLDKLRELVDSEETQVSINTLKELQKEWRSLGPVPPHYARNLWANYNALLDRFYDKRSIYFELKELDRRKNLESKLELCQKAEALSEVTDIREAVRQLDELHEEYKHIGPVPQEEQEALWERFKTASNQVHDRRRENVEAFKKELHENMKAKLQLCEEASPFASFQSESIKAWNQKTRELQTLQKKWEAIGSMPRDRAREVNKKFWSDFKQFFAHKSEFFKSLDHKKEENLKKKEALIEQALSLQESEDWRKTTQVYKDLQQEWKNIGPVPDRVREEVYQRFKAACDHFFERRRSQHKAVDSEYEQNLKAKKEICAQIEKIAQAEEDDPEKLVALSEQFSEIGFVPRHAIKSINERFDKAIRSFIKQSDLDEQEKQELKMEAELTAIKNSPSADRKIHHRESQLRKKISRLEEEVALWRNNITFFASSKQADKLKADFEKKIEQATDELEELKSQLGILQNIR